MPVIEEKELGVKEYWYEGFRRVLLIPSGNCIVIIIDLYKPGWSINRIDDVMQVNRLSIVFSTMNEHEIELEGKKPTKLELVGVKVDNSIETIAANMIFCGIERQPSYEDLWVLYRKIVSMVEGRDPEKQPLKPEYAPLHALEARTGRRRPKRLRG